VYCVDLADSASAIRNIFENNAGSILGFGAAGLGVRGLLVLLLTPLNDLSHIMQEKPLDEAPFHPSVIPGIGYKTSSSGKTKYRFGLRYII
jgi:hypothetical protein